MLTDTTAATSCSSMQRCGLRHACMGWRCHRRLPWTSPRPGRPHHASDRCCQRFGPTDPAASARPRLDDAIERAHLSGPPTPGPPPASTPALRLVFDTSAIAVAPDTARAPPPSAPAGSSRRCTPHQIQSRHVMSPFHRQTPTNAVLPRPPSFSRRLLHALRQDDMIVACDPCSQRRVPR